MRRYGNLFLQSALAHNIETQESKGFMGRVAAEPITNKNGRYPVCLIVGGPADIFRELQDKLGAFGIAAIHHWEWKRPGEHRSEIPKEVDFVILLKSKM